MADSPDSTAPDKNVPRRRWLRWPGRRSRRVLLGAMTAVVLVWFAGPWLTPVPPALLEPSPEPALIVDRHGAPLRHPLDPTSGTRRAAVEEPLPDTLVKCLLAAEDSRFQSHDGFDFLAAGRAVFQLVKEGEVVSGASTITQQLVKVRLHRDQPRTALRKVREIWLARALERKLDKASILEAYLEEVDFGNLNRGVRQASRDYFGKPLAALSLAESATLAGLPLAPSRLNPRKYPDRARQRRDTVLDRLAETGNIPAAEIARARAEPMVIRPPRTAFLAPHFADLLAATPPGGITRTTLDSEIQSFATARLRQHLRRLADRNVNQGAVLVLENTNGGVLALVGSGDYREGTAGQVNHALSLRSPGSTLKPFTYLLGFENGFGPWSVLADIPTSFPSTTGPYRPANFDKRFRGPVTAREALANSLNVPAVRLLNDCGGAPALVDMMRRFGFTLPPGTAATCGLGLTLGNAETTLWDLAVAYGTLARGGFPLVPTLRLDAPANVKPPVIDPALVWLVTDILRDNTARSGSFSLDSPLRLPFPAAVKTGTSTDFRDNWTVGYTPEYTVAVWVGNSDNSPMRHVSGVDGAGPIFAEVMGHLHRAKAPAWPDPPPSILVLDIDPLTGKRVPAGHPRARREFAHASHLPPSLAEADTAANGRVILPAEYRAWLASPENRHPARFAGVTAPLEKSVPRILFPAPGTTIVLDPSLPDSGGRLTLESDLDEHLLVEWTSPTLAIAKAPNHRSQARLTPGRHELTATHPGSGQSASTWIEVKER
ncbi:MAG: penicillin-binding protein 1C [Verrucomicrobiales bacterium]